MTRIPTPLLAALKNRGVDFRASNYTLQSRHLSPDAFTTEAEAKVASCRVAEIAQLQAGEGYVYLKS